MKIAVIGLGKTGSKVKELLPPKDLFGAFDKELMENPDAIKGADAAIVFVPGSAAENLIPVLIKNKIKVVWAGTGYEFPKDFNQKLIDELNGLEQAIVNYSRKNKEVTPKIETLEGANKVLILENSTLKVKILELETKIESLRNEIEGLRKGNSNSDKERQDLKAQIDEIINKIDNHLRS